MKISLWSVQTYCFIYSHFLSVQELIHDQGVSGEILESFKKTKDSFKIEIMWPFHCNSVIFTLNNLSMSVNPSLFIKSKQLFISSEGFSTLEKKLLWYVLRGQCCPSSRLWQPSADSNGGLTHFSWNLNFLGWLWQPSADNNGCMARFTVNLKEVRKRAVTLDQIIQQNNLEREGGP